MRPRLAAILAVALTSSACTAPGLQPVSGNPSAESSITMPAPTSTVAPVTIEPTMTESTEAAPTPTDMPTPKPEATPREGPFGSIAPGPAVRTALPHKAPKEVAQRTPLPSCGQYGEGPNEATTLAPEAACFADAVSTKRPAEVVHIITSTEGGTIVELFRYAGSGNVVLYMDTTSDRYSAQNWTRTEGKLFVWDHSISVSGDAVVVA